VIRIDTPRGPPPFNPAMIERGRAKIERHYRLDDRTRRQQKNPVEDEWHAIRGDTAVALMTFFHGKCAYCESVLRSISNLEIDRFRPLSGASNLTGEGSLDHYTWLALEWGNFYASCAPCNRAKRSLFPVKAGRAPPLTPLEAIDELEAALLIDPCRDEPHLHLEFNPDGSVRARTERGETAIKVLNLNRTELARARHLVYRQTWAAIEALGVEALPDGVFAKDRPHLAVVRAACLDAVEGRPVATAKAVPKEERSAEQVMASDDEAFRLTARPLRQVEIENFKLIRHLVLDFPSSSGEEASWLMLLGENASGKSTVLQAIGLALAGAEEACRLVRPSQALTEGAESGFIRVHFWDHDEPVEIRFHRGARQFEGNQGPSAIVLGYGALRYPEPRRGRSGKSAPPRFSKIAPLLRPVARIPHPGRWLSGLDDIHFDAAARALQSILPVSDGTVMSREKGKVIFKVGGHVSRLGDLSAGYQTVVGLSADIMRLLFERWQTLSSATAIVLVDEIDAHLHPRWKMRIVKSLREAFPLVQFVASTHDPLVLRGVRNGEVALLRRDEQAGAVADQQLPPVEGMQVDELLTSRHFGLESTLDPAVELLLNELYHLQSLPSDPDRDARIAQLKAQVGDKESLGRNRREQLMLEAADSYLQSRSAVADPAKRQQLKKSTIARLQSIIDDTVRAVPPEAVP
jgi:uncharacterized protein (TIGR02646 family)